MCTICFLSFLIAYFVKNLIHHRTKIIAEKIKSSNVEAKKSSIQSTETEKVISLSHIKQLYINWKLTERNQNEEAKFKKVEKTNDQSSIMNNYNESFENNSEMIEKSKNMEDKDEISVSISQKSDTFMVDSFINLPKNESNSLDHEIDNFNFHKVESEEEDWNLVEKTEFL